MVEDRLTPIPTSVIVVDDHAAFREAARSLLEAGGFDVVAEAATACEAVALARRRTADVMLLDVRLPDVPGWRAAELLHALLPDTDIVLISSLESADVLSRVRPGVTLGFLAKHELTARALRGMLRSA